MNKKSFSLIEVIFTIMIIAIISSQVNLKNNLSKIKLAKQQILLHLKYTRYIAMLDNKYNHNDKLWFRKRWTMKFLNCQKEIGGIYYIIYSDENLNGSVSKSETLIDPLTHNYMYSFQCKQDNVYNKNKLILISKRYNIKSIDISCNKTKTIGQLSFDSSGELHSKLSTNENESDKFKIKEDCTIKIKDDKNNEESITITKNTGFIY